MKWTMVGFRSPARAGLLAVIASLASSAALAQLVVSEDFTSTHLNNSWTAINGACLTAGAGDNGSHVFHNVTLNTAGAESSRRYPFNARDYLALINEKGAGKKPPVKKKIQ